MVVSCICSVNTEHIKGIFDTKSNDGNFPRIVENGGMLLFAEEDVVGNRTFQFRNRQWFAATMLSS